MAEKRDDKKEDRSRILPADERTVLRLPVRRG